MPAHHGPQPPAARKMKKHKKRIQNGTGSRQQADQFWATQQRQSRRWLAFQQEHKTFGTIPGAINLQLLELMQAKNAAQVTEIWRRGLAPQTMELWEKLKAERDAAKAASNLFLAPDWWVEAEKEGGGEGAAGEEVGGEEGGEEGEGEGGDGDVAMEEGGGGEGEEGAWVASLAFRG